jgi:hypothetical protein
MAVISPTQSDRVFDLAAAAVPGGAAAYSANRLAPLFDWQPAIAISLAVLVSCAMGLVVMRVASRQGRPLVMPYAFATELAYSPELLLDSLWDEVAVSDGVLLLEQPVEQQIEVLAELMLDDPLPPPEPDSRVVQLFSARPNAGELVNRIQRHLGRSAPPSSSGPADATDALRRALEELRLSLRQA